MRVISPYHDYYDTVQSLGQDQTQIYLRTPKKVEYTGNHHALNLDNQYGNFNPKESGNLVYPFHYFYATDRGYQLPHIVQHIIGFCGKIYPCIRINDTYCYTIEAVDTQIEPKLKKQGIEEYHCKKKGWWSWKNRVWPHACRRPILAAYFEKNAKQNHENTFVENKCPTWTTTFQNGNRGYDAWIEYNACLKNVQFYRVIEPFTAFQEISMYFGNIAQPGNPIPHVSDTDLAAAKGFDKYSFRKDKTKK